MISMLVVADLIDNCLAANATNVGVRLEMEIDGGIVVSIADNGGIGMSEDELIEAMQYGARSKPHPLSLGKFGLGLKQPPQHFVEDLAS